MKTKLILVLLLIKSLPSIAQEPIDSTATKSIDGIVKEILNTISGEKEKERDWQWFRQLFVPEAKISAVFNKKDGTTTLRIMSVDEFIEITSQNVKQSSFYETEISKIVEEYNGIAHVFQAYKVSAGPIEEEGINSIQLAFKEGRWFIVSLLWTGNRNGIPLPEKYLAPSN